MGHTKHDIVLGMKDGVRIAMPNGMYVDLSVTSTGSRRGDTLAVKATGLDDTYRYDVAVRMVNSHAVNLQVSQIGTSPTVLSKVPAGWLDDIVLDKQDSIRIAMPNGMCVGLHAMTTGAVHGDTLAANCSDGIIYGKVIQSMAVHPVNNHTVNLQVSQIDTSSL